jgi:hypothetical protein
VVIGGTVHREGLTDSACIREDERRSGLADGTSMDKAYPPEAWKRLGEVLEIRRGQLGYGFRQREQFLRDRGGPPPSVKTLARLERGERDAYPPATLTRLESLYGYAPGSFEAVLAGGEPVPAGEAAAPAPVSTVPRRDDDPRDDAAAHMFEGDTSRARLLRSIWRYSEDEEKRFELIEVVDPKLAAALRELAGRRSEASLAIACAIARSL